MVWGIWVGIAAAAPSRAVVVGSNRAGPGQVPLQWADSDAERIGDVLVEIGGFAPDEVEILLDPGPDEVLAAIDRAAAELAGAEAPSRFLFYYSGHARARTLTLGPEELSVSALDAHLQQVPAQQRLAVLDACQSGEPGAPKGVAPEAAFSFVSVAGLTTAGTAVVASSTAEEMSQESPRLGASTFTHHWVTALRGAADTDHDGAVTLDEAYDYAYHRTVVDTAATAIGAQHPTLRVERSGHGDWILSRSTPESARIALPAALAGAVTVVDPDSGHVVAEVAKQPADTVLLAVAPGSYRVVVHSTGRRSCTCEVTVDPGETAQVAAERCPSAPLTASEDKGSPSNRAPPDFSRRFSVAARGGVASYGGMEFLSAGAEIGLRLSGPLALVVGGGVWNTRRVLPTEIQMQTGIYSEWNDMFPVEVGALYAPFAGRLQPYAGLEGIAVQYHRNSERAYWCAGPRLRAGLDLMATPNLGFQVDAAFGAWHGGYWPRIEMGAPATGLIPQISAGLLFAR